MKIIDGLGECGVLRCSITGGEPLIRPDFWEIVDALIKNDILISTVYTNGFLLRDDILEGFEERGLRPEFNMSFDGIGCHDWMRGIDGAETAVRRAFELCKDRGFPTGAEMCLWKENAHTLSDSINYLASVGCRSIKVNPVGNTGAWLEGGYAEGHSLSTEETFELYYNYLDDFYRDLPQMNVHLGGFFMGDGRDPDKYNLPAVHASKDPGKNCICGHARNTIYISPEGRALTCMAVSSDEDFSKEYPLIQEYGVKECLDSSKYMELINTRSETVLAHNERCRDCSYKDMCLGGCRAAGLLSHPGDILGIDEGTCLYFREGWKDKIIEKISKLRPEADRV
jgi:radical SAM protein with 4Fe4S-binding SPASM domain